MTLRLGAERQLQGKQQGRQSGKKQFAGRLQETKRIPQSTSQGSQRGSTEAKSLRVMEETGAERAMDKVMEAKFTEARVTRAGVPLDPGRTGRDATQLERGLRRMIIGQDEAIQQIVNIYQMHLTG